MSRYKICIVTEGLSLAGIGLQYKILYCGLVVGQALGAQGARGGTGGTGVGCWGARQQARGHGTDTRGRAGLAGGRRAGLLGMRLGERSERGRVG